MLKAYILPKTPCKVRSNFQMMGRVLKLIHIDSKVILSNYQNAV